MKAAVISVPSRGDYLNNIHNIITNEDVDLKVYMDYEKKGHWFNYFRMFKEMLEGAKKDEPILLLDDDMITIKGWKKYWEVIHEKANNDLYVFYSSQKHLFKEDNINRGYITKVQPRGFYTCAGIFINQQDLPSKVMKWFESKGKYILNKHRQTHLDVVIQEYLIDANKSWTITTPTLFEHIGYDSVLGHKWEKGSSLYIGNL
jgi:hypothetical protein